MHNIEDILYKTYGNVNDWLKFAEAKNFGLLTFNAAIVFGVTQIDFATDAFLKNLVFTLIIPVILLSTIAVLISLMPILSAIEKGSLTKSWIQWLSVLIDKESGISNIHFFGHLRSIDTNQFQNELNLKLGLEHVYNEFQKDLIEQILYNSRIAHLKYQLFKIGGFVTLAVVVGSFITYLLFIAMN